MCNPAAILVASVGMNAAKAGANYVAAKQQAKATEDHQKRLGESMVDQHSANMSNSLISQAEQDAKAAKDRSNIIRRASAAQSVARTSALESGAMGNSFDMLMNDYEATEAELLSASMINQNLLENRFLREREQANLQTKARLLSNYRPINQPSPTAAILEFAGDSLQAAGNYYAATGGGGGGGTSWSPRGASDFAGPS